MPSAEASPLNLPAGNCQANPRGLHMEIMNLQTRDVWLSSAPISKDFFNEFAPETGWIKLGMAHGAMDAAGFRRSPGAAEDGPLETREFGGHPFFRVARPEKPGPSSGDGAPMKLTVHKHHTVAFKAGAKVRVLRAPEGLFVEASRGGGANDPSLMKLAADMRLFELEPARPWTVEIPAPATVYFFPTIDVFHGPVEELPEE